MAKYGELFAGKSWLGHYATLDSALVFKAERTADFDVDGQFADWDRHLWSGTLVPPEVAEIWEMVASAKYIARDIIKGNPTADLDTLGAPGELLDQAGRMTAEIRGRGWLIGNDGEKQYPKEGESGASNMSVDITR